MVVESKRKQTHIWSEITRDWGKDTRSIVHGKPKASPWHRVNHAESLVSDPPLTQQVLWATHLCSCQLCDHAFYIGSTTLVGVFLQKHSIIQEKNSDYTVTMKESDAAELSIVSTKKKRELGNSISVLHWWFSSTSKNNALPTTTLFCRQLLAPENEYNGMPVTQSLFRNIEAKIRSIWIVSSKNHTRTCETQRVKASIARFTLLTQCEVAKTQKKKTNNLTILVWHFLCLVYKRPPFIQ